MPAHLRDLVKVVSQKTERRKNYLQWVEKEYQFLPLIGMGVDDLVPIQLPLLDLYVPLKASRERPVGGATVANPRLAGRPFPPAETHAEDRLGRPEPVVDLLRAHPAVVILGDPGSGKTTFLKYLALRFARDGGDDLGLGSRLPLLVPLSEYGAVAKQKTLGEFIHLYFKTRCLTVPLGEIIDGAFNSGAALLLLDGLDEVRDAGQRSLVVKRVVNFFTSYQAAGNRFVVTSRIVGYRQVRPVVEGLVECTLLDFDDVEIEGFVEKWTAAIELAARGATPVAEREAGTRGASRRHSSQPRCSEDGGEPVAVDHPGIDEAEPGRAAGKASRAV